MNFMLIINNDKSQGWKNILQIIIPYFFIVGICQLVGFYFAGGDLRNYKTLQETPKQLFIIMFFSLIGHILIVFFFRKYVDKQTIVSLGFGKEFIIKDILLGLLFGFCIMLLGFVCLIMNKQIIFKSFLFKPIDFLLSVGVFIFVAVFEEIFLRGYILNNLLTSFNKYTSLIISSIIFSLMHAPNPNANVIGLFGVFVAGIFFGLSYIYTKSLWFPIGLHFSWNFFQGTIFGFNVSGKSTYSLIVTKMNSHNIWNGGDFGFEGSLLSIFFQLFAILIVFIIFKNRLTPQKYLS